MFDCSGGKNSKQQDIGGSGKFFSLSAFLGFLLLSYLQVCSWNWKKLRKKHYNLNKNFQQVNRNGEIKKSQKTKYQPRIPILLCCQMGSCLLTRHATWEVKSQNNWFFGSFWKLKVKILYLSPQLSLFSSVPQIGRKNLIYKVDEMEKKKFIKSVTGRNPYRNVGLSQEWFINLFSRLFC